MLRARQDREVELAGPARARLNSSTKQGRTPLRAGERPPLARNAAPSYAYAFNSASWDAFDRWSEARRDQRLGVSTQYLPEEVRPYAASFEQCGAWRYESLVRLRVVSAVSPSAGARIKRPLGQPRPYGWTWVGAAVRGPGRHTTTAAGASRRVRGSGFRGEAGRRPGCRGRTRPDMSAGARSAGTIAPSCSS